MACMHATPFSNLLCGLAPASVECTKQKRTMQNAVVMWLSLFIVHLLCYRGSNNSVSDYSLISCCKPPHIAQFRRILPCAGREKCKHALWGSGFLKQQSRGWGDSGVGRRTPGHQPASLADRVLKFRGWGSLQEECVFIFLSQDWRNALFSGCSVTSEIWGARVSRVSFNIQFEDSFWRRYMKVR